MQEPPCVSKAPRCETFISADHSPFRLDELHTVLHGQLESVADNNVTVRISHQTIRARGNTIWLTVLDYDDVPSVAMFGMQ